ncbi:hypothetical protein MNEG_2666 [Monoraphidium neglectum]|uniref:glutathione gamma-glutamylcysteinyltransferase n=1 Tax=Monoraphidium neglectum TaxID=145388 RepID=A0A0D2MY60_9CHLO|nr:hypothetical protein MNEG_2666 [Monoraphidium neglectum]KIZ05292.1 hypothetical protein MNEG_2666 [Monoraphidium neglectum]|eukprot:XP_013904311.1 hypothetical protein MNEG_2666 [Monoraphidium neglectum]
MTADDVKKGGMTLAQLSALLSSHNNVSAQATHASDLPLDAFRKLLRTNVASPSDRLLVNYNRPEVGQQGGGHISPVAAYSQLTDRALVMDVARYRYPASWVAVPDLWRAALAVDSASGLSRGVVVVRAAGGGGVVAQAPVHAVVGRR